MLPVFAFGSTPRLQVRTLLLQDARELLAVVLASRDELGRYMSWPRDLFDLEQARRFVKLSRDGWLAGRTLRLGIFERSTGVLLGSVEVDGIDFRRGQAELGYWIRTDRCGRGYATEAANAMVRYGFETLRVHKIRADVAVGNSSSARVLAKLGFTHEGTLREDRPVGSIFVDHWRFGLLQREYVARTVETDESAGRGSVRR